MMTKKEKKRVPELRFPGFEEEWEKKKYKNIYSFITTNSYSRNQLNYEDGEVKNIHYGDIHTKFPTLFDITKELVPFINSDIDISRYKEEHYIKEGDLVIADASEDYADIGKTIEVVNLNNEKVLSGLHTFLARPITNRMAIGFSGYMLQTWSVRKQVMTIAQGTKVRGIASGRLGDIFLIIPEKEEQEKIATFLTSIDTRIQQLEKKKTLLEQYKKGVMQRIFSQEIRFKRDDGEEFPKWEKKRLGDIGVFKSGIGFSNSEQGGKVGIPFYKVSDMNLIGNEDIMKSSNNYVTQTQIGELKYNVIKENSIIFAKVGAAIFLERKRLASNFLIDNNMMAFTPKFNVDFCKYLFHTLRLAKYAQVGALPSYNASDLKIIKVEIPTSLAEQTKIAHFLSALDEKIAVVNEQVELTKEWKKGLLQRMFV